MNRTNSSRTHQHEEPAGKRPPPLATMHATVDPATSTTAEAVMTAVNNSTTLSSETTTATATPNATTVPLPTRLVLSALAGMGAATFCHPLDVVRVQMQTSHFRNTWHAATSIYQTAGLRNGLYAGISAAYLRQWLYGSCRIGIYSYLLEKAKNEGNGNIPFSRKLAMGSIAGGIGSFVGTPSELALVRMSADSKLPVEQRRNYKSVVDCIARVAKEEGLTKLWRGATPTVARATLLSSVQMGVTSETKLVLAKSGYFGENGQWLDGYPMMVCSTLFAALFSNTVANPFDVMKSRLQNMQVTPGTTPPYTGMVDCFFKSVRQEGILVLWAGFTPAFVKLAPYSVISLTLADKLTRAVTGKDAL